MTNSSKLPQFKFEKYVNSNDNTSYGSRWKRVLSNRFFRMSMGIVAGAVAGLLYWKFVGCHSGTCSLTSSPFRTVIMFSFMGALFAHNKPAERDAAK